MNIVDYDKKIERFKGLLQCEIVDRPVFCMSYQKDKSLKFEGRSDYNSEADWLNFDRRSDQEIKKALNTVCYGDEMPIVFPDMGPEIYSAWCGCGYNLAKHTTWSEPCIFDWERDFKKAVFDKNNKYYKAMIKYIEILIEKSKKEVIIGLTDFHPGGDHLAALRDPQELCIDMIENVDYIKAKLDESYIEYFKCYDFFYDMLKSNGMGITSWTHIVTEDKYYIPSNDFSCMISNDMFKDVFLEGIIKECQFLDSSIYHLDGPGALQHLNDLLDIKELDAIQWVRGAGNGGFAEWAHIYKRIQEGGKASQVMCTPSELDLVFETLKPEGSWLTITEVDDEETAKEVEKRIIKWA